MKFGEIIIRLTIALPPFLRATASLQLDVFKCSSQAYFDAHVNSMSLYSDLEPSLLPLSDRTRMLGCKLLLDISRSCVLCTQIS